jgi:hypothetical protein
VACTGTALALTNKPVSLVLHKQKFAMDTLIFKRNLDNWNIQASIFHHWVK